MVNLWFYEPIMQRLRKEECPLLAITGQAANALCDRLRELIDKGRLQWSVVGEERFASIHLRRRKMAYIIANGEVIVYLCEEILPEGGSTMEPRIEVRNSQRIRPNVMYYERLLSAVRDSISRDRLRDAVEELEWQDRLRMLYPEDYEEEKYE